MNSPYIGKFKVTQIFKGLSHDGLDLVGIDSKEIHSTVNGTVEKAGWENTKNKKQGFGLYIRIKQENSADRYYYGHLDKVTVKVGQKVKNGDLIGIEGNTGNSTGSHCHYCIRGNASKTQLRDVNQISGIENRLGTFENETEDKKTVAQIAKEVLSGKWGNGTERKERLISAGYSYTEVQAEVNRLSSKDSKNNSKSNQEIAKEVIKGLWGNGNERKERLQKAGYNYTEIQKLVNKMI